MTTEYKHDAQGRVIELKEFDASGKIVRWRVKRGDVWVNLVERDQEPITQKDIKTVVLAGETKGDVTVEHYEAGKLAQRITAEPAPERQGLIEIKATGEKTTQVPVTARVQFFEDGRKVGDFSGLKTSLSYYERPVKQPITRRPGPPGGYAIAQGPPDISEPRADTPAQVIAGAKLATKQPLIWFAGPEMEAAKLKYKAAQIYEAGSLSTKLMFHGAAFGRHGYGYLASYLSPPHLPGGQTPKEFAIEKYAEHVLTPPAVPVTVAGHEFTERESFFIRGGIESPIILAAGITAASFVPGAVLKSIGTGIKAIPFVGEFVATEFITPATLALATPPARAAIAYIIWSPVVTRATTTYKAYATAGYAPGYAFEKAVAGFAQSATIAYFGTKGFQAGLKYGFPVKLGSAKVVTTAGEQTWRGIYAQSGKKAKIIFGALDTKVSIGRPSFTLDQPAMPYTPLEFELLSGPTAAYYAGSKLPISDYVNWIAGAEFTRGIGEPRLTPQMTLEQSLARTKYVKLASKDLAKYFKAHRGQLYVYGSVIQQMYQGPDFRAGAGTADVDIMTTAAGANVKDLLKIMQVHYGAGARVSAEFPTLIETQIGGEWHHALDIHTGDLTDIAGYSPGMEEFLGLGIRTLPPIEIERFKAITFGQQLARKGVSITTPTIEGVMPAGHRAKDITDLIGGAEFYLSKVPDVRQRQLLDIMKIARGIDVVPAPSPEMFVYSPPAPAYSPPGFAFLPAGYFSSPKPGKSPSISLPSYSPPSISMPSISPPSRSPSISPSVSISLPSISPPSRSPSPSPSLPSISPPSYSPPSFSPSISPPSPSLSPPSYSPSKSPSISPPSYSPPVFRPPSLPPIMLPFGKGSKLVKLPKLFKHAKVKTVYKPSLGAYFFDVKAKKPPKVITGLSIRPRTPKFPKMRFNIW